MSNSELEIKDASLIFQQVWKKLEQELGRENLCFPKEIMWLGGAPGAGKGSNTPFIMRERGLTAEPIVMSELLNSPQMEALKARGRLVGDREVLEILLRRLLLPEYQTGVVVDGFPRTKVQVASVKMLHEKMLELRTEYWGTPTGRGFRRPIFRITVLFVDEQTSVERQLKRGREIQAHNQEVTRLGEGKPLALRPTDIDENLARNRYRTFKEQTFEALTSLREHFHYHFVNAQAPLEQVEANIIAEFQYQSSLELGHSTYDIIHDIPVASEIILHARQELVRRLDSYEHGHPETFKAVSAFIRNEVAPSLSRHAVSGRAHFTTESQLFEQSLAVDILIDTLCERGYRVWYRRATYDVADRVDLKTGIIHHRKRVVHGFDVTFRPPEIRRGH